MFRMRPAGETYRSSGAAEPGVQADPRSRVLSSRMVHVAVSKLLHQVGTCCAPVEHSNSFRTVRACIQPPYVSKDGAVCFELVLPSACVLHSESG